MGVVQRLFLGAALCAALTFPANSVLLAAGNPSPTPLPLPANDYSMGRAPQNCPMADGSMLHVAYNNKPNVVPHRFWWIGRGALVGYSGWIVQGRHVTLHFGPRTKYGYPQKVFWQPSRDVPGTVTLRGWNLRTRQRIWFGNQEPLMAWTTGHVDNHLIFVPSAGCYLIRARWKSGGWSLPFAAGCEADPRLFGVAHCR